MTNEYKKRLLLWSVSISAVFLGIMIIKIMAESRWFGGSFGDYAYVYGVKYKIFYYIRCLAAGLFVAVIPYEKIYASRRDVFLLFLPEKYYKHRHRIYAVIFSTVYLLLLVCANLLKKSVWRTYIGLSGFLTVLGMVVVLKMGDWIKGKVKLAVLTAILICANAFSVYKLTGIFIYASFCMAAMLISLVATDLIKNKKLDLLKIAITFAVSANLYLVWFFLTGHDHRLHLWLEGDYRYKIPYANGILSVSLDGGYRVLYDHPFIMINMYLGPVVLGMFIALIIALLIMVIFSSIYVARISAKRCGMMIFTASLFLIMMFCGLLADMELIPTCRINFLVNIYTYMGLALYLRCMFIVKIPDLPEYLDYLEDIDCLEDIENLEVRGAIPDFLKNIK